jgi:hypothetical protein
VTEPPKTAQTTPETTREADPETAGPRTATLLEQMGGIAGLVSSTVPVAVFVIVNLIASLQPALIAAIAVAVAIAVWRLSRREVLQPAISGLFGVGVCAFIAYRSGAAKDFFLPGLWYSGILGGAFLLSVLVRWPLAGVVWHALNGEGHAWRQDRRLRTAYTVATLLWAAVFGARLLVQGWLYNADETTWLAVARLAMGYPLLAVALLGTVWAVRRAKRTPQMPAAA